MASIIPSSVGVSKIQRIFDGIVPYFTIHTLCWASNKKTGPKSRFIYICKDFISIRIARSKL